MRKTPTFWGLYRTRGLVFFNVELNILWQKKFFIILSGLFKWRDIFIVRMLTLRNPISWKYPSFLSSSQNLHELDKSSQLQKACSQTMADSMLMIWFHLFCCEHSWLWSLQSRRKKKMKMLQTSPSKKKVLSISWYWIFFPPQPSGCHKT